MSERKATFIVNEKVLETFGTGSLIGFLAKANGLLSIADYQEITIRFQQTSLQFRKKNGGPAIWCIPEYAIQCLLEDILKFRDLGIAVKIETEIVDPT